MTTLVQARAELVAAIDAAGIKATDVAGGKAVPYVLVAGAGIDLSRVISGRVEATFRAICVAGGWDEGTAIEALDAMKLGVLSVLAGLAGWRLGEVGRDGIRSFSGSDLLTADVSASRLIDL